MGCEEVIRLVNGAQAPAPCLKGHKSRLADREGKVIRRGLLARDLQRSKGIGVADRKTNLC
jgi:hypothetical protein